MSNRVLLSSYLVANTVGPSVKKAKKVRSFIHSFIYSFFRCIAASEDRAEAPGGRGEVPGPAYRAARRCAQQTRPSLPRGGQVPGRGAAPTYEGIFLHIPTTASSVADPGSGAFLTPGSGNQK